MTLFEQLKTLGTERVNPSSAEIDLLPTLQIVELVNAEDAKVASAVATQLGSIARVVDTAVEVIRNGGSIIYVGAGTSGRLGVVDASEMPPTFGTDPEMVRAVIAGGPSAVFRSVEGAEDDSEDGEKSMTREIEKSKGEGKSKREGKATATIIGLSASGRTPFVLGALKVAHEMGMPTALISTNDAETVRGFAPFVDELICPVVGAEVIMGSTRMKSGTAQKMVLNMISTAVMVRLGKTYGNVMVDLQQTNEKLIERARRIVMTLCNVEYTAATDVLQSADGHVKTALVMASLNCSKSVAEEQLLRHDGFVRPAMKGPL